MLLAIDAGNTNISLGVFDGEELLASWRLTTDPLRTADEYGIQLRNLFDLAGINFKQLDAIIVASVVPHLEQTLEWMSDRYFQLMPSFVSHVTDTGLQILYDQPAELGADRIVDAVAAVAKYGAPCIVIDFGTATTFNAVNSRHEYLGGIIAPGLVTAASALSSRTAKLPLVEIEKPEKVIATSTVSAIQSGLYYGYAGLIDRLIEQVREEMGESGKVIATGGLATLMEHASKYIDVVDATLTLDGLRLVYERNKA